MKFYYSILILSTLIQVYQGKAQKEEKIDIFENNRNHFDSIDNCGDFLNILEFFSKNDTLALFDNILPYYDCTTKKMQDVSNFDCCNNLQNATFSIVQWPNFDTTHELENLYVPDLWQGICHPDFCSADFLQENKEQIDSIIKNLQLNYWITKGQEKIVMPEGNGTNQTSAADMLGDGESNLLYMIKSVAPKRETGGILYIIALFIIFTPLFLFILVLAQNYLPQKLVLSHSLSSAFDYRKQIQSFVTPGRKNDLNIFNFFRVIGVSLIFLIHSFQNQNLATNFQEVANESHRPFISVVYFAFEAVDLFLFMGGFFQAISWASPKKLQTFSEGSFMGITSIFSALWQRFLRVWPVLFIVIMLFTQIFYQLGSGPLWWQMEGELNSCDENMYSNLLFIDNLFSQYTWKCFGHSWYLSVDIQLYFFCLICLCIYSHNKTSGKTIMYGTVLLTVIYNLYFAIRYQIRALDVSDLAKFEAFTESTTYYTVGMFFYRKPWARAPIFISGLLLGISYIEKTGFFSKDFVQKYTVTFFSNLLLVAVLIITLVITIPMPLLNDGEAYSRQTQSLYFGFMPLFTTLAWILLTVGLIYFYNLEKSTWVNKIVDSAFISMMAKISFIMYLSHILQLRYSLYSGTVMYEWTVESVLERMVVNFVIACCISTFLHIYFEAPLQTIINNLVKKKAPLAAKQSSNFEQIRTTSDEEKSFNSRMSPMDIQDNENEEFSQNKASPLSKVIKYFIGIVTVLILFSSFYKPQNTYSDYTYTECYFSCSECQGPGKYECTECHENFDLTQENECELKEKVLKANSFFNQKLLVTEGEEGVDSEDALSAVKDNEDKEEQQQKIVQKKFGWYDNPKCADDSVPFVFFKKGMYQSRWILHFSKMNHLDRNQFQNDEDFGAAFQGQIENDFSNLQYKQGIYKAEEELNPGFWNYTFATFTDCTNAENNNLNIDNKMQQINIESQIDFLVNMRGLNFAREILFVGLNEYEVANSLNYGSKIQKLLNERYNIQTEISYLFDGVPTNSEKYVSQISKLQDPIYFVLPSFTLEQMAIECKNEALFTQSQKYKDFQTKITKKQLESYTEMAINMSAKKLNDIYIPPCSFEGSYILQNMKFTNNISNEQSVFSFWLALRTWRNELKGQENLFQFPNKNSSPIDCEKLNLNSEEVQLICWGEPINFEKKKSLVTPDFLLQEEEINQNPWESEKIYPLDEGEYGQKCIAGGQPFILYKQGKYPQRIIFNFQGGGMSKGSTQGTYEEAVEFTAKGRQGDPIKGQKSNIFPNFDRAQFQDYSMIVVYYCDGHLEQGYMNEPLMINDKKYWLRGMNNTLAAIDYSFDHFGFGSARQVILMGGSSGGITISVWMDYLRDRILSVNEYTDVRGIISAGLFMDFPNMHGEHMYKEGMIDKGFWPYTNNEVAPPNEKCVANTPKDEMWKCLFVDYNIQFIETPVLIIESGYDYIAANQIMNIYCYGQDSDTPWKRTKGPYERFDMSGCNQKEMEYLEAYREELIKRLDKVYENKNNLSIFMPSCGGHNIMTMRMSPTTQVPDGSGNAIVKMIHQFIDGGEYYNLIDRVKYPNNRGCANKEP